MNGASCWFIVSSLLLFGAGVAAAIIAAVHELDHEAGFLNELEFFMTSTMWLFVWGIVAAVMAASFALDGVRRNFEVTLRPPDVISWFWTILLLFLLGPWNFFGHTFLLRAWTPGSWSVYAMLIVAVAFTWLLAFEVVRFALHVFYVHNRQIGISRFFITAQSDENRARGAQPILAPEDRFDSLPTIMAARMPGVKSDYYRT